MIVPLLLVAVCYLPVQDVQDPAPARDGWEASPVVVDEGPLLFYAATRAEDGRRVREVHVVAPRSGGGPQVCLRSDGNVRILRRVGRDRILFQSHGTPYGVFVLDLSQGTARPLLPGVRNVFAGACDDRVVIHEFQRGQYYWMARPAQSDAIEPLLTAPLAAFLGEGRHRLAITAGTPRALWTVDLCTGTTHRVGELPEPWQIFLATYERSPSGERLALGVSSPETGYAMLVLDAATGAEVARVAPIELEVSPLSSQMPSLAFTWLGDHVIRFSETVGTYPTGHFQYVDYHVVRGERLGAQRYAAIDLSHRKPAPPQEIDARTAGPIERRGFDLYWRGEDEPVVRAPERWDATTLSPDGAFATHREEGRAGTLHLLDGRDRSVRLLTETRAHDFVWLEAVR